jgi:hypothetical protein
MKRKTPRFENICDKCAVILFFLKDKERDPGFDLPNLVFNSVVDPWQVFCLSPVLFEGNLHQSSKIKS